MIENIVTVENLSKSYGEKTLFEDISFGISKGEKIALVARNGEGKSSLLRILIGKEIPDGGKVIFRNDLRIAYLEQTPQCDEEKTILEILFDNETQLSKTLKSYQEILAKLAQNDSEEHRLELEHISSEMDRLEAWNFESKVEEILSRLHILNLSQPIKELSGGERKKIALSKVLIDPVDLMILDEPTNHLDIEMTEWLEHFLLRQNLSILLVSHDRYLLDKLCTSILEIDQGSMYKYKGNYSQDFIEQKAVREAQRKVEIEKAKNLYRKELEWMRRMPKARSTKSKARIDAFDNIKEKALQRVDLKKPELSVKLEHIGGKILEIYNISKSFGHKCLINDFSYVFKKGEKIGIVGANGVGKSSFLNLLTEQLAPDQGKIIVGQSIRFGYYTQNGMQEKDETRVIDIIKEETEIINLEHGTMSATQFLTYFGFSDTTQYNLYKNLSGGEQRRLHLIKTLIQNPNFLILDEPTNDLDLITISILEDFLLQYKGCLLIVSHDRSFMDNLVDHIFVFEGEGKIKDYHGNYSKYRLTQQTKERPNNKTKGEKKQSQRTERPKDKAKVSFKEQKEYASLTEEVDLLSNENKQLLEKLNAGSENHAELQEWSTRISEIQELLDEKELRWLELDERINA